MAGDSIRLLVESGFEALPKICEKDFPYVAFACRQYSHTGFWCQGDLFARQVSQEVFLWHTIWFSAD